LGIVVNSSGLQQLNTGTGEVCRTKNEMKKEIFKANGKSFTTYEALVNYLREISARVTNTETFVYKGTRINTISISNN